MSFKTLAPGRTFLADFPRKNLAMLQEWISDFKNTHIEHLVRLNCSPEVYSQQVARELNSFLPKVNLLKPIPRNSNFKRNHSFWRVSRYPDLNPQRIESFGPPPNQLTNLGRCNIPCEPTLYTSDHFMTAYNEWRLQNKGKEFEYVFLSEWKLTECSQPFMTPLTLKEQYFKHIRNGVKQLFKDHTVEDYNVFIECWKKVLSLFSVQSKWAHIITSSLSKDMLQNGIYSNCFLAYDSVHGEGLNFAFPVQMLKDQICLNRVALIRCKGFTLSPWLGGDFELSDVADVIQNKIVWADSRSKINKISEFRDVLKRSSLPLHNPPIILSQLV